MVSKSRSSELKKNTSTPKELTLPNKRVVIGKIYSDFCGYCNIMKPEWEKMKQNIKNRCNKHNIPEPKYLEIESNTNLDELDEFNKNNQDFLKQTKIEFEFVPTIFVVDEEGLKYYEGERISDNMENFMLDRYYKHHNVPVLIGGKKSKKTNTKKNKSKKSKNNTKTKKNFFAIFGF
jgi:hypothetical protein